MSELFKSLLKQHYQKLIESESHVKAYSEKIKTLSQSDDCQRLQQILGVGPITASALYQHIGNGCEFKNGRAVSASLGLVPKQHSSGGKHNLLGISKSGDGYLRTLLIHGARAVIRVSKDKDTPLALWVKRIEQTRGKNKAAVALANKLARIAWAIQTQGSCYKPEWTIA